MEIFEGSGREYRKCSFFSPHKKWKGLLRIIQRHARLFELTLYLANPVITSRLHVVGSRPCLFDPISRSHLSTMRTEDKWPHAHTIDLCLDYSQES